MIDHQRLLAQAFRETCLSVDELWARYVSLGGEWGMYETDAYLNGLMGTSPREHNILTQVINDHLRQRFSDTEAPPIDT